MTQATPARRLTLQVRVGNIWIGSDYPIRVQSMTTTNTMDTEATIAQSIRMIEAGSELVRITAPSQREARNLENIRNGLRERGYTTPLVADIHYTPNAAEIAARIVEKVRVNPGNYVDKKMFAVLEYDDISYQAELDRIRERFTPLVRICREYGTAMRIGTNHGSLSDRIVNRYGDNPEGMVQSALEFLRICEDEDYRDVVVSMKSSNPIVMIEAYRLFVRRCSEAGLPPYPLHLGVTEAGDGTDGRIKSAVGIGTLVDEGLGDTIRVSLTEEPEAEIPVARLLARRIPSALWEYASTQFHKRHTTTVANIGGDQLPRVVADVSQKSIISPGDLAAYGHTYQQETDKWATSDQPAEYFYVGQSPLPFTPPLGTRQWVDVQVWRQLDDKLYTVPVFRPEELTTIANRHVAMNVVRITPDETSLLASVSSEPTLVVWMDGGGIWSADSILGAVRSLASMGCSAPLVIGWRGKESMTTEELIVAASADLGAILVEGIGNGVLVEEHVSLAYGILQATRMRMTKTEYISCPSCGRTLFDLQETTALIRSRTDHLKGVKIGIMGCIVNGPGEMADADYGYVGSGPDKITLYRGQEIVKRGVPTSQALDELVALMKEDGRWVDVPGQ